MFCPLALTKGVSEFICPLVSCTGFCLPAASAQISVLPSRVDWKRKYLPSGVQLPQHSEPRWLQSVSKRRAPFPDSKTSHMELRPVALSKTVSRRREPSGDHRNQEPTPGTLATSRALDPSLRDRYTTVPWTNAISLPSGDQVASSAAPWAARLSAPPGKGKIQSGGSEASAAGVSEGLCAGTRRPNQKAPHFGARPDHA